jgi:hypothetical protein
LNQASVLSSNFCAQNSSLTFSAGALLSDSAGSPLSLGELLSLGLTLADGLALEPLSLLPPHPVTASAMMMSADNRIDQIFDFPQFSFMRESSLL